MPTSTTGAYNAAGDRTRQRLLDAAAECFAENGFADTSVRDITARAGCNVAAVNYYFGGKGRLYHEVFAERLRELTSYRVGALNQLMEREKISADDVLKTFANAFLEPLIDNSRGRITLALLMRDFLKSYLPPGMVVQLLIQPTVRALMAAFKKACPDLEERQAQWCIQSLIAQLFHFLNMQKVASQNPNMTSFNANLSEAVEHIVRFTKAGLLDYAENNI